MAGLTPAAPLNSLSQAVSAGKSTGPADSSGWH